MHSIRNWRFFFTLIIVYLLGSCCNFGQKSVSGKQTPACFLNTNCSSKSVTAAEMMAGKCIYCHSTRLKD
jgi:hypothetical protein